MGCQHGGYYKAGSNNKLDKNWKKIRWNAGRIHKTVVLQTGRKVRENYRKMNTRETFLLSIFFISNYPTVIKMLKEEV